MYEIIREVFMKFQPTTEGPVLKAIRLEQDIDQLDRWLDRVISAKTLDEVFASDG